MTKQVPAKKRKSEKKALEQEYQYTGELAEIRKREEKFKRTGKIDLDDYPIRYQTHPRTII